MKINNNLDPLICPHCGFECLHQERVIVFDRGEDQERGLRVSVTFGKVNIGSSMKDNPSSRRDAVVIEFRCEGCEVKPRLAIIQHKGSTFFEWLKSTPSIEELEKLYGELAE